MAKKKVDKGNPILNLFRNYFDNSKTDKLQKLDTQVDALIQNNISSMAVNGQDKAFAELFSKMLNNGSNPQYEYQNRKTGKGKELSGLLSNIDTSFDDLGSRKDLYNTYRFLVKNIPQLNAALSIIVENIISPDEIFKEIFRIVPVNNNYVKDSDLIVSNTKIEAMDVNNIINLMGIEENIFSWFSNCLLTGNTFIEIIDSEIAINTYFAEDTGYLTSKNDKFVNKMNENRKLSEEAKLNYLNIKKDNDIFMFVEDESNNQVKDANISEYTFIKNIMESNIFNIEEAGSNDTSTIKSFQNSKRYKTQERIFKDFRDMVFNNDLELEEKERKRRVGRPSREDLAKSIEKDGNEEYKAKLQNLILKQHNTENVIRLSNSGFLLGYLIVKEKNIDAGIQNKIFGSIGNTIDLSNEKNKNTSNKLADIIIDKILDKYKNEFTSNGIDKSDIDNTDVRKTIASIITEKKSVNIRFVPPNAMIEFINYSEYGSKDYGTSLLDSCLFMAKYYLALLISYTIFNITRAPEKRLFKIEVENDSNIRKSIEEVIRKVKQKELVFQNFDRLDAMPKELTAFNDIFVPSVNGQAGVSVEGIPGQSGNIDISYLDEIRKMVIYATKVPPSLLGDSENSYHTSASQENYKFARTIVRYQQQFQTQLTEAISKIYYMIAGTGYGLRYNKIVFNPPAFTKVEQVATMIGQADVICNFVVDSYGLDPNTQQPLLPKKVIAREYAKFIDWDKVDQLYNSYKLDNIQKTELQKLTKKSPEDIDQQAQTDNVDDIKQ